MEETIDKAVIEMVAKSGAQVYKDLAQPLVSGVGKTLGLIPASINAALTPLQIWIEQKTFNVEETKRRLAEKLKNANPEHIVSPAGYVAIPALQAIAYCTDSDDLRNMYANILAASMVKGVKDKVHPAFVEIIKQLCPDEAKLIRYMAYDKWNGNYPLIDLRKVTIKDQSYDTLVHNFTDIGEGVCEYPYSGIGRYVDNLQRLGLIEIPFGVVLADADRYVSLENNDQILKVKNVQLPEGFQLEFDRKKLEITDYGWQFINICVKDLNFDSL